MIYDALEMEYRKLKVRKDPNCALCGENPTVTGLIDYETFCGAVSDEASEAAAGSTISVAQLEHMLKERDNGERDFVLVDVREPNEYEINHIPGAVLIPKGEFLNGTALEQLPELREGQADRHALQVRRPLGRDARHRQGRRLRRRRARGRRRRRLGQPDRPEPADVLTPEGVRRPRWAAENRDRGVMDQRVTRRLPCIAMTAAPACERERRGAHRARGRPDAAR